jgi:hypothetical protein
MDHIGIDVHKRESQICILAEGGELARRATDLHGRGPLRGRALRSTLCADRHGNWPLSWATVPASPHGRSPSKPSVREPMTAAPR